MATAGCNICDQRAVKACAVCGQRFCKEHIQNHDGVFYWGPGTKGLREVITA